MYILLIYSQISIDRVASILSYIFLSIMCESSFFTTVLPLQHCQIFLDNVCLLSDYLGHLKRFAIPFLLEELLDKVKRPYLRQVESCWVCESQITYTFF